MSRVTDTCDDIVTIINAGSYTQTGFTAVRTNLIHHKSEKDRKLDVYVWPSRRTAENITRNSVVEEHSIEVIVLKPLDKTGKDTNDDVDTMLTFVDELIDDLNRASLATAGRKVIGYSQEEYFDLEALHEQHLFISTITLQVRDQF